jgi:maltokinase
MTERPAGRLPAQGASAALAHHLVPAVPADAAERVISTDQVNHTVLVSDGLVGDGLVSDAVVGDGLVSDAVVVKWLMPPAPLPHRGADVLAHLTEVGFTDMPRFLGAHEHDGRVVAMLSQYIPHAREGWDWYVEELTERPTDGLVTAARLGVLAARLHRALATPSSVIPAPVATGTLDDEARHGEALLDEAVGCTAGEAGERLAARAALVRAAIGVLHQVGPVPVQPIHGDLHAGQFLRSGDTIVITDFDGNPLIDPVEQRRPRSTLVDLASLLQSIDHVGRMVVKRNPHRTADVEVWIGDAIDAAHAAYRAEWPEGIAPHHDEALTALRAVQELHEFVYAARALPVWLYVPDAALSAMFPLD